MKLWNLLIYEDIDRFRYFLEGKTLKNYQIMKLVMLSLPLLLLPGIFIKQQVHQLIMIPVLMVLCYKLPYVILMLHHTQNCNEVIRAIPLWVNQIYALIEKNTIHNAIVNSLCDHTPKAIQKDLQLFIDQIQAHPDDKDAYLNFLARYHIDGFLDIMLKLYEFRSLSKEKLKYEIKSLNHSLGKIETLKRQSQFQSEIFMGDTCTCFIIFIPCIYMTVISLMPSLFSV